MLYAAFFAGTLLVIVITAWMVALRVLPVVYSLQQHRFIQVLLGERPLEHLCDAPLLRVLQLCSSINQSRSNQINVWDKQLTAGRITAVISGVWQPLPTSNMCAVQDWLYKKGVTAAHFDPPSHHCLCGHPTGSRAEIRKFGLTLLWKLEHSALSEILDSHRPTCSRTFIFSWIMGLHTERLQN